MPEAAKARDTGFRRIRKGVPFGRGDRQGKTGISIDLLPDAHLTEPCNAGMFYLYEKVFADQETEKACSPIFPRQLPQNIQRAALRRLILIDNAGCLEGLNKEEVPHG